MMDQFWILASNSPRRKELLGLFQQPFLVVKADIDETEYTEKPMVIMCPVWQKQRRKWLASNFQMPG
jgi:predicted house-cleaning NTP pyrophosphatase (Maf/HAM1 superfamily)